MGKPPKGTGRELSDRRPVIDRVLEISLIEACWLGCTHRKDKELSPSVRWVLSRRGKASA